MIIAVDGPAAAGKGTLARALARAFDLAYLDTGLLYRAVAARVLSSGGNPADPETALAAAQALDSTDLDDPDLRSEAVGEAASKVAALPEVRQELVTFQRRFAADPPDGHRGAVLDGRDIGTVICPQADVKLFVTADIRERARRRHKELLERGHRLDYQQVLDDMRARDARDAGRAASPMVVAEDAHLLDTTNLDIDSAFRKAKALIAGSAASIRN